MTHPRDSAPAPVYGRDDLTCPVAWGRVRRLIRYAKANPWRGDQILGPGHNLDTEAILEPGRPTRVLFSLDYGYHKSGWFANSEFERCWHLSISHPRPDRLRVYRHQPQAGVGPRIGMDVETPSDDEARAWARVFFQADYALALFEPAVGPLDPYRAPGVVHLRLFVNQQGEPFCPAGEVYNLLPFSDGSSPAKVTEGRLGADVR